MRSHLRCCSVALLALAGGALHAADSGGATEQKTTKMKQAALAAPMATLSPRCVNAKADPFSRPVMLKRGAVVPMASMIAFRGGKGSLTVGGATLNLAFDGTAFGVVNEGGRPTPLRASGVGFEPISMLLSDKKTRYPVIFPYGVAAKDQASLYWRPAWAQAGRVGASDIQLLDDDGDGNFNADKDAMTVGSGPVFMHIPKILAGRTELLNLQDIASDGTSINWTKNDGDSGNLTLAWQPAGGTKSVGTAQFALVNSDGSCAGIFDPGTTLKVAPGSYQIAYGLVHAQGKAFCAALRSKAAAVEVTKDAKAKIELGAPFKLQFQASKKGDKVAVLPMLTVSGKGGEDYVELTWQTLPVVSINGKVIGSMEYG